ncbi:S24 family peptidase [Sphingomonas flavalba]|uniref:S24 family peptidase n=1 Tax=Sphingomonas flavalba TaxID=2559804 RepID=UPI0039DFD5AC
MGKIVKGVAAIGLISLNFIPAIGQAINLAVAPALFGAGMAATTAVAAASAITTAIGALGVAAGLGLGAKTLGLGPKNPRVSPASQSLAPRMMVGNGGVVQRGNDRRSMTAPFNAGMSPKRAWWHQGRWALTRCVGDCMEPHVLDGRLCLIDRAATIRPDDLVIFKVARRAGGAQLGKRFRRIEGDRIVFETTNPTVELYSIALSDVQWCYRVRRYLDNADGFAGAVKSIDRHNERLGICVYPGSHRFG